MEIFAGFSGFDFLIFYAMMLATCVLAGLWIAAVMRPEGRGAPRGVEEIAVLSGGAERHASATLSALFAKDALEQADRNTLRVARGAQADTGAERVILSKVADFTLAQAKKTLGAETQRVEHDLVGRGLLMDKGEKWRLRLLSVSPYAALFVIGLYRQQAGAAQGEPTGLLVGLLIATVIFALIRLGSISPRTKAGHAAIKALEEKSSRMRRAPQSAEAGYAVALFGTAVLVGTPWEPLHAVHRASSSNADHSSSDSGDSGCGGGGCGGGCGGCGG